MTDPEPEPRPAGLPNPIELLVFAPVGLATLVHERLQAEQRRVGQQVQLYRFVGRLTVQQGRTLLKQRIDRAVDARRGGG
jgi:hypothetical protein